MYASVIYLIVAGSIGLAITLAVVFYQIGRSKGWFLPLLIGFVATAICAGIGGGIWHEVQFQDRHKNTLIDTTIDGRVLDHDVKYTREIRVDWIDSEDRYCTSIIFENPWGDNIVIHLGQ